MHSIPFFRPNLGNVEIEAVSETIGSGWLTSGPKVHEFEQRFARAVGAEFAVALSSATAALHLSLVSSGIGPGDEVIIPTLTFASAGEVVLATGATPVLVDSRREDLIVDPAAIKRAITERTRVIMPMHYGGVAADLMEIVRLAAKHEGSLVFDDAAHAFPSSYGSSPVGSQTDGSSFSFYANKTITTGEGGMFTTNDERRAQLVRQLSLHGLSRDSWRRFETRAPWDYSIEMPGWKYNLTDLAAAIGLVQLAKADEFAADRRRSSILYDEAFSSVVGLEPVASGRRDGSSCHLYVLRVKRDECGVGRDDVITHLQSRGIGTSVHYRPLHMHAYYVEALKHQSSDFPVAAQAFEEIVSLPLFPGMIRSETDAVISEVLACIHT